MTYDEQMAAARALAERSQGEWDLYVRPRGAVWLRSAGSFSTSARLSETGATWIARRDGRWLLGGRGGLRRFRSAAAAIRALGFHVKEIEQETRMNTTTEAPSRPDLLALDEDTRIRIWVAEVRGAAWRKRRDGCWALSGGSDLLRGPVVLLAHGQLHRGARSLLPRYLDDPAAWGRLVEAERISLTALHPDGWSGSPRVTLAYWGDSPGLCRLPRRPRQAREVAVSATEHVDPQDIARLVDGACSEGEREVLLRRIGESDDAMAVFADVRTPSGCTGTRA